MSAPQRRSKRAADARARREKYQREEAEAFERILREKLANQQPADEPVAPDVAQEPA